MKSPIKILTLLFFFNVIHAQQSHNELPKQNEIPNNPFIQVNRSEMQTSYAYNSDNEGVMTRQVNVDADGNNIVGDAANEPSIAVDPNNPNNIVIGWRQFDTTASDFRQAGYSYSTDGGETWTFQ